jgi:ribosomal protein S27AE
MSEQSPSCVKCGGPLIAGALERLQFDGENYYSSDLDFTIPGVPTSRNLIKAVKQGMAGEKEDEKFKVIAWRCSRCGFLELYAGKPGQK